MNDASVWYIGINGQQQGPLVTQQVIDMIRAGHLNQTAYVYGQMQPQWTPIGQVPLFAQVFAAPQQPAPPPPPQGPAPVTVDQIDFEILGGEAQFVEIVLDPGEAAIADASALFFMDPPILPEADGALTKFGNAGNARHKVAFAAGGKILPIDLRQHGGTLLVQPDAFLCAAKGIALGGDGPLKKLEGQGQAFLHVGGAVVAKELAPGEVMRVDAGSLAALEPRTGYAVQGALVTLTGPGRLWLQSLPAARRPKRP